MSVLYLLSAGTPTPTKERFGTSCVLQIDEDCLMFDCGPAATHKLVKAGLFPTQVDYLFFTHHHFDHNADYPCFLLCRWDQSVGKENRLQVFGPSPTEEITKRLIGPEGAFFCDWMARVGAPASQLTHANRGGSLPRPEPSVDVRNVGPGEVVACDRWRVTAARIHHVEPWLDTLAYRVDAGGRSIVFAGDSRPCPSLLELARGVNVLVISCWDHQKTMEENGEVMGISGTLDVAAMARDFGVKKLILTHTGPRLNAPGSREKGIGDIARIYSGEIVFGEELMRLDTDF